jgi:hypothetical protein
MAKSLFSICLLIASALAWSSMPDEGHREVGCVDAVAVMADTGVTHSVDDVTKLEQPREVRSIATVAHAEHVGQGYRGAATTRVIGPGSSGVTRTASNPPDI